MMCKKLIVLALVLGLVSSALAAEFESAPAYRPKVVFVTYHEADDMPSENAAAAGFTEAPDKGYTDLLEANGYDVTRYLTTDTPDPDVLNAVDLVIIGRSVNSGHYDNDGATAWHSITAPMIISMGHSIRSSRMGYTTGTSMAGTTGDIRLAVNHPTHPIFKGITLTDGTMNNPYAGLAVYPDGITPARGININTDPVDDEGMVLAVIGAPADDPNAANGPAGGMVIAEWQAGAALTHQAGTDILAGRRLVFLTGAQEAPNTGGGQVAGLYDLLPDGEQMYLNAVQYMLYPPVHEYTLENFSFELPGTEKLVGFDNVPGWNTDGPVVDSGVELDENATDGEWTAYLMSGDPSIWQVSDLTLNEGDVVELTVDAKRLTLEDTTMYMSIYYDVFGNRMPIASQDVTLTDEMAEYTLSYEAVDVVPGANIGVEFLNVSSGESWIVLDNVRLSIFN